MHPVMLYLLKMLLCSAVLLGYYWVALRNERFHQWNRFYLLSAMLLSVLVPFMNIPLLQPAKPTAVVDMVAALPWNNVVLVYQPNTTWSWKEYASLSMLMVSGLLLLHLLRSVWKVVRLYRHNTPTYFHEVSVVITEEPSAPFSFFKWLFWRSDIDPDSSNGQRMLQHELTHIHEKHSADKLFAELLLIVFWMNPFFWLMRRELYAIHEFLADQQAIERYDGAAFAAMILQVATGTPAPALSNPFFTAHLKRRLHMITASHEPKYSYLRRISGLVLMIATAAVLVVSIDKAYAQDKKKTPPPPPPPAPVAPANGQWPELPDSIRKAEVIDKNGHCYIKYEMKDGRKFTYELNAAKKKGYFIPPPPPPKAPADEPVKLNLSGMSSNPETQPLFIYAGLEITQAQLQQIDPNTIASIDVLKGESATKLYGEKGKNGVIMIHPKTEVSATQNEVVVQGQPRSNTSKPATASNGPGEVVVVGYGKPRVQVQGQATTLHADEVVVTGYPTPKSKQTVLLRGGAGSDNMPALIFLDGKRITAAEMQEISPDQIGSINVLKDGTAVAKYGAEAEKGVIEIYSKKSGAVFAETETPPAFPGNYDGWRRYLERNLQYPNEAQEKGIQGKVVVQFVVDTEGNLSDIYAMNDPGGGLAQEAVRIIKSGPKWVPALQNGQKVIARTSQTITFRLE
ncbi:M56 family metallopeptidase [Phnomibacter ginsenosidimutans]|uniref:TonB family protein n=1 Tax=Phnomibacter ginsenosidimutans TaxID=2676868 RepID=A0A6I6GES6_9BACT|nr:M56 family metallopeptidase [Phnomibacter ginsenosidimutans]QGW26905.1 TonB family protein [Phnomibacter ginsenosidimutans]